MYPEVSLYLCPMRNAAILGLAMATFAVAQNVGIGTATPASRLSVSGNLSVGAPYAGTAAPPDGAIFAGSVGIGTPTPNNSAGLDVNFTNKGFLPPRVALTGPTDNVTIPSPATGLIVYNTGTAGLVRGLYYNQGTPAAPQWVSFNKQMIFHSSSTNGVTLNTNGAVTQIPGTAITIVIPSGFTADIDIYAYAGILLTGGVSTSWAVGDLIIYKNGAPIPLGGWNRVKVNNRDGTITDMQTTAIISRDSNVPAGTYTYDLRGSRVNGDQSIRVGGNCAIDVNCAEMTIIVNLK